jgi:hypothetical protein
VVPAPAQYVIKVRQLALAIHLQQAAAQELLRTPLQEHLDHIAVLQAHIQRLLLNVPLDIMVVLINVEEVRVTMCTPLHIAVPPGKKSLHFLATTLPPLEALLTPVLQAHVL